MPMKVGFAPLTQEPNPAIKTVSAGMGACIAELATFPLDTAKVRLMIQGEGGKGRAAPQYRGLFSVIKVVSKTEGVTALYSGLVAGFHRQMVLGSVRIGLYDSAKVFFSRYIDGENTNIHHTSIPTRICAGITTGIMAVSVGQPTDVVKVRMQAQGASGIIRYNGALSAYKTILTQEGLSGLWKGLAPNAMRTAIVNAAEIVSYDLIKTGLVTRQIMSDNAPCHLVSALGAALITTVVASPVDVLKTRYMNSTPGQYSSILHCALNLWKEKGVAAFYKGCIPSFWRLSSWNVIMFTSYEQLKRGLVHTTDRLTVLHTAKVQANDKWE